MRSVWYRLRSILLRRRMEREMREEMARDVRGSRWLDALTPDAKLAMRMLLKNPLLSIVGGLGMAVAIAIATGFFTFMTYYYSDPPVEEGDRVVTVGYINGDEERSTVFDYLLWRSELASVFDLAAYCPDRRVLESPLSGPLPARGVEMTASGFRVFRVPPLIGRPLLDSDEMDGAHPVVVIGFREWQEGFDGDPDIVGRGVRLNGALHTIVGVMPEGFAFPSNHGFWTPLETGTVTGPASDERHVEVFGRLAPRVDMAAAEDEVAAIGAALTAEYPEIYQRYRAAVRPYIRHLMDVQHYPPWLVWLIQLFAVLILTVVAVNVAVLVYARTAIRRGEITVRTALGASRSRIVTQFFLEALALSTAAAALGLLIANVGFRQLTSIRDLQDGLPHWIGGHLPPSTVFHACGLALFAALVVGVPPALQATGRHLESTLRQLGGATGLQLGRTWTFLICLQVAVAVGVLPVIVGIAWNYTPPPIPTFMASDVLTFRLEPISNEGDPAADSPQVSDSLFGLLQTDLLSGVETIPGVTGVTFTENLPRRGMGRRLELEGGARTVQPQPLRVLSYRVGPDYLEFLGVPLLAGRGFDGRSPEPEATAAIVSRAFAELYFPDGAALGKRFREVDLATGLDGTGTWYEIVGVVEDLLKPAGGGRSSPSTYHPISPGAAPLTLLARMRGANTAAVASDVREVARGLAPGYELAVSTLDALFRRDPGELAFLLLMVGLITGSVLLLSAGGISAMTSFAVTRRHREIGIRTALGASRRQIFVSIFARSGLQLGLGLLSGGAVAAVLDRVTDGAMLDGETAPLLAFVATIMLLSGLLATIGPARRAWRTQPMDALREE